MDLPLIKLLFDTGMLVLIWLVQLVIYPSFIYYSEQDIDRWHRVYTQRVSIIVLPLMVGQLILYGYSLFSGWVMSDLLILGFILFCWVMTFFVAVPLHNKIQDSVRTMEYRQRLVTTNWLRTFAWTVIFIISLTSYYAK